jgi:hypothetical protein
VAEQAIRPEASCLLAAMLRATQGILAGLDVYSERMHENLGLLDGLLVSEAVMLELARHIGRQRAHEVVYELCMDAVEGRVPLNRASSGPRREQAVVGEHRPARRGHEGGQALQQLQRLQDATPGQHAEPPGQAVAQKSRLPIHPRRDP